MSKRNQEVNNNLGYGDIENSQKLSRSKRKTIISKKYREKEKVKLGFKFADS